MSPKGPEWPKVADTGGEIDDESAPEDGRVGALGREDHLAVSKRVVCARVRRDERPRRDHHLQNVRGSARKQSASRAMSSDVKRNLSGIERTASEHWASKAKEPEEMSHLRDVESAG